MPTQQKKIKNAIHFIKDEYGVFFSVIAILSIAGSIFTLQGLPLQILPIEAKGSIPSKIHAPESTNVEMPELGVFAPKTKESALSNTSGSTTAIHTPESANSITIPKLGVFAPLSIVPSTDPKDFIEPLSRGVVHFPSALPGESGTTIILGHSAPFGWPSKNYQDVFSNINLLENKDIFYVRYNGKEFTYEITGKKIVKKGEEIPSEGKAESELQLITCWPPGIDYQRIVVFSKLIKQNLLTY